MTKSYLGLALLIFATIASLAIGVFKLFFYPDLSWWIVFLPFWMPVMVAVVTMALMLLLAVVVALCEKPNYSPASSERDVEPEGE